MGRTKDDWREDKQVETSNKERNVFSWEESSSVCL